MKKTSKKKNTQTIYVEMVADLFHYGHVEFLRNAKALGDKLVVGVLSDEWTVKYKRKPVLTMQERAKVIEGCRYVDEVILQEDTATPEWLAKNDYIHAIALRDEADKARHIATSIGHDKSRERYLPYQDGISTTDIIKRIKDREVLNQKRLAKIKQYFAPRWSGAEWILAQQMLEDIGQIFNNNSIPYFLAFGSHIGAVRHGCIIPWDDDIDMAITEKDESKLEDLIATLREYGYGLSQYTGVVDDFTEIYYKIWPISRKLVKGKQHSWPFVDIFVLRTSENNKNLCGLDKREFDPSYIFPLKQAKFGPLTMPVPNNPDLLSVLYADDYMTKCMSTNFIHRTESMCKQMFAPTKRVEEAGCFVDVNERAQALRDSVPVRAQGWKFDPESMQLIGNGVQLKINVQIAQLWNAIDGVRSVSEIFNSVKGPRITAMNMVLRNLNVLQKYKVVRLAVKEKIKIAELATAS